MKYLNIEISTLHSPEYIGSKPVARATWLNVAMWCAGQENGGRIVGAKHWGNRQWQQTCGVTVSEVNEAGGLLVWEGEDLTVSRYPINQERKVMAKREGGREGGIKSGEARRQKPSSIPSSTASPEPSRLASTECNVMEEKEKGREEEDTASACGGPSLHTWLARVDGLGHPDWWQKKWFSAEKTGWMSGRSPIVNWEVHQDSLKGWFQSYAAEKAAKNAPPDTSAVEAENAAAEARRLAKEAELVDELKADLARGRE